MAQQVPPFPQNSAHGNGTCEQCGEACAVFGPRWCPVCYYVDGVPRDLVVRRAQSEKGPGRA